ncbi:hypothetical protein BOTBODRAFT_529457 [Botryobasidium botryosum FD-172 SS1]|uniref:Uncharacterized protein n=1 Tax=Botryobasidium botryosum (strain FD-172 SS1) TaxID=930990 RepID=A0A067MCR6_BOTB1|nr:hypothetical protein BOTBODRAFT_529457 [Botryobasidium botryosum FD-172 SS1]
MDHIFTHKGQWRRQYLYCARAAGGGPVVRLAMGCLGVCGSHSPAPCVQPRSESRAAGHPDLSRPIVRVYTASLCVPDLLPQRAIGKGGRWWRTSGADGVRTRLVALAVSGESARAEWVATTIWITSYVHISLFSSPVPTILLFVVALVGWSIGLRTPQFFAPPLREGYLTPLSFPQTCVFRSSCIPRLVRSVFLAFTCRKYSCHSRYPRDISPHVLKHNTRPSPR